MKKFSFVFGIAVGVLSLASCGVKNAEKSEQPFTPSLDTEKTVTLVAQGGWDNFEALVEVESAFNEYYPNFSIQYSKLKNYNTVMENGGYDLLFNTRNANAWAEDESGQLYKSHMLDLKKTDIDLSNIKENALKSGQLEGAQYGVHLYEDCSGLLVNEDLLSNAGFSIPTSLEEFETVCDFFAKKDANQRPILAYPKEMGRVMTSFVFSNIVHSDKRDTVINDLKTGTADASIFNGVIDRFNSWKSKGYFNEPEEAVGDNYDKLILEFFNGNAPFAVGTSGTISGCKKRETKEGSTYGEHPFKYSFCALPDSTKGNTTVLNVTLGMLSINKDSENLDYCKEFLKFATRKSNLATFSQVKGMPSTGIGIDSEMFKSFKNIKSQNVYSSDSIGMQATSYTKLRESLDALKNENVTTQTLIDTFYKKINPDTTN